MAEDLRVQRTKKAIKTAFIELVNEEDFADVTIKGITEKAIINRQTFYNYYQDKYDLTEHLNNEYLEILKKVIQYRVQELKDTDRTLPFLSDFYESKYFTEVLANREAIMALMTIQYNQNSFKDRLRKLLIDIIQEQLSIEFTDLDIAVIGSFYINMISFIAKNNVKPTEQDLAELRKLVLIMVMQ